MIQSILKNRLRAALLCMAILGGIFCLRAYWLVSNVEYLIFEGKEKEKLYIKDRKKAQEIAQMFLYNPSFQHACGYEYTLTVCGKNDAVIYRVHLNGECDEFWFRDAEIQSFIKRCQEQLSKP